MLVALWSPRFAERVGIRFEQILAQAPTAGRRQGDEIRQRGADQTRQFLDLFSESDLVKFAKVTPEVEEAYALLERARHLVEITRPVPETSDNQTFEAAFGPQTAEVLP